MIGRIKHPRFPVDALTAVNPLLLDGEVVYESETGHHKIGDGVKAWNDLPYAGGGKFEGNLPAYRITQDSNHRFVTDAEKTTWNNKAAADLANVTLVKNLSGSTTGYYKAPDGLLLEWGYKSGLSSGAHTVYFPISFYTVPAAVLCTIQTGATSGDAAICVVVKSRTSSYFQAQTQWASETGHGIASEGFYWLAVGRWK